MEIRQLKYGRAELEEQIDGKQKKIIDSEDISINEENKLSLTQKAKYLLFCDRFNQAAGEYGHAQIDEDGNFDCELNGLKLSYEEALIVDRESSGGNHLCSYVHAAGKARTFYTISTGRGSYTNTSVSAFAKSPNLEVIRFDESNHVYLAVSAFTGCAKLRRLLDGKCIVDTSTLANLPALEYVEFEVRSNTDISKSPKLEYDALYDSITETHNSYDSTARTVTVHPKVYAKLTGQESEEAADAMTEEQALQWQSLVSLAAGKNITFATTQ